MDQTTKVQWRPGLKARLTAELMSTRGIFCHHATTPSLIYWPIDLELVAFLSSFFEIENANESCCQSSQCCRMERRHVRENAFLHRYPERSRFMRGSPSKPETRRSIGNVRRGFDVLEPRAASQAASKYLVHARNGTQIFRTCSSADGCCQGRLVVDEVYGLCI